MESHLLQMRGLKQHGHHRNKANQKSHLLQMRGLKRLCESFSVSSTLVASFTDAWIETDLADGGCLKPSSHLLQMRGLKHCIQPHANIKMVASFTDAWIETTSERLTLASVSRRIFYRCVD